MARNTTATAQLTDENGAIIDDLPFDSDNAQMESDDATMADMADEFGSTANLYNEEDSLADQPIDFTGVDETEPFPVLPKGNYPGVVEKADWQMSKQRSDGKPRRQQIKLVCIWTNPADGKSTRTFEYLGLDPESQARTKKTFLQLMPNFPQNFIPRRDSEVFVGRQLMGSLDVELGEDGTRRNKVAKIITSAAPDEDMSNVDPLAD